MPAASKGQTLRVAGERTREVSFLRRTDWVLLAILAAALFSRLVALSLRLPIGGISFDPQLGSYNDYEFYYIAWLRLLGSGLLPYRDFFYQYPPLFLYGLYPLYRLAGAIGPALAMVAADSGSAVLVCLIGRRVASGRVAAFAGFAYALSPFAVLYEGYVLFSLQPMLFFVLLSVYFVRRRRLLLSAVALAVGALFQQEALFALPAYLLYLRGVGARRAAISALAFGSVLVVVSLPFLIAVPLQYLGTLAFHPPSYPPNISPQVPVCFYSPGVLSIVESCVQSGVTSRLLALPASVLVLDSILALGIPFLALLPVPFLVRARESPAFPELCTAFCFAVLLAAFAVFVSYSPLRELVRSPYLPFYAFLLVSGRNWKVPALALSAAAVSLVLPPGVIQACLPFLAVWAVAVVELRGNGRRPAAGHDRRGAGGGPYPTPS